MNRLARLTIAVLFLLPVACEHQSEDPVRTETAIVPCGDKPICVRVELDIPGITKRFEDTGRFESAGAGECPYWLGMGCYQVWDVELARTDEQRAVQTQLYLEFCDRLLEWQSPSGLWTYREANDYLRDVVHMEQRAGFVDDRTQSRVINHLVEGYRLSGDARYVEAAKSCADFIAGCYPRIPLGDGFLYWSYVNLGDDAWIPSSVSFNHNLSVIAAFLNLYRATGELKYLESANGQLEGFRCLADNLLADDGRWYYGLVAARGEHHAALWAETFDISGYQDLETSNVEQVQTRLDCLGLPRVDELDRVLTRHVALQWELPCEYRACSQYLLRVEPEVWDDDSFSFRLRGEEFPIWKLPTLVGYGKVTQFGPITFIRGFSGIILGEFHALDPAAITSLVQDDGFVLVTSARVKRFRRTRGDRVIVDLDRLDTSPDAYVYLEHRTQISCLDPAVTFEMIAVFPTGCLFRMHIDAVTPKSLALTIRD